MRHPVESFHGMPKRATGRVDGVGFHGHGFSCFFHTTKDPYGQLKLVFKGLQGRKTNRLLVISFLCHAHAPLRHRPSDFRDLCCNDDAFYLPYYCNAPWKYIVYL